MADVEPQETRKEYKFERLKPEDTAVSLNRLCAICVRLTESSKLLKKFSRQETIKDRQKEILEFGPYNKLRAGYLDGCHLCAMFWWLLDGKHLLHDDHSADDVQIMVSLTATARDSRGESFPLIRLPFIATTGSLSISLRHGDGLRLRSHSNLTFAFSAGLEAYLETNPFLNHYILGKVEEPISSKSDSKLNQIVGWYGHCIENHENCTRFPSMVAPSRQLPSRLLDLGDNKLRLECDVESIPELRYTTLSHVWGKNPESYVQLKKATLKSFMVEIPFDVIPIKYKDAVRITRALKIRYLWIDSLCIIQDSPDDWKTEALKMAAVYGGSACNISYTHEPSEEPAKRYLRDPRTNIPCKLTAASPRSSWFSAFRVNNLCNNPSVPAGVIVQRYGGTSNGSWSTEGYRKVCSLLSRAWVFQERLLCPRTVYYGHNKLLWECCETFNDEFGGPMQYVQRSKARFYSMLPEVTQNQALHSSLEDFTLQWASIVNEYRTCKLTHEKDRAIAFAGIASAIQWQTGRRYLAGIWKEAAHFGLLWCVRPTGSGNNMRLPGAGMQEHSESPSWSWFSVHCQPNFDYDVVDYRLCSNAALSSNFMVYSASILSFEHPKFPGEPEALFYDFEGLRIRLSTYRVPAGLRWENGMVQLMPHGQPILPEKPPHSDYDPRTAMMCNLDDLSLDASKELPNDASMILLVYHRTYKYWKGTEWYAQKDLHQGSEADKEASPWWISYSFNGLVVVPEISSSGHGGSWKRIGVYSFNVQDAADLVEVVLPFDLESQEPDEVWLK